MKKIKNLLIIFTLFLSATFIFTGCSSEGNIYNSSDDKSGNTSNSSDDKSGNKTIGLSEMFTFDDLEITLGNDISFTKINNRFSDYNGQDVVKIPITVKNISDETHSLNMFYFSIYGANGTQLSTVASYFDDSIDFAGDLRSSAAYTKYLYFLYDGDGTYSVEFDKVWGPKTTVEFTVLK